MASFLDKELDISLRFAFKDAAKKRHEFLTSEHLLLALLENGAALEVLRGCGADTERLRSGLQEVLESTTPLIPEDDTGREAQPTLGFQRVIQRAIFHAQTQGRKEVSGAGVLVAVFSEQESHAVFLLKEQGINRVDVVNYI